jgi:hypothetical protein
MTVGSAILTGAGIVLSFLRYSGFDQITGGAAGGAVERVHRDPVDRRSTPGDAALLWDSLAMEGAMARGAF